MERPQADALQGFLADSIGIDQELKQERVEYGEIGVASVADGLPGQGRRTVCSVREYEALAVQHRRDTVLGVISGTCGLVFVTD